MLGYTIEVISSSHQINEIRDIVFNFIHIIFNNYLQNITNHEFISFQNAILSYLCTPSKSIIDASSKYWNEIEERRYNFNINQEQVSILKTSTLEDIYNFYERNFINQLTRKIIAIECSQEE